MQVIATTRTEAKANALRENGADDVVIDTGQIADEVKRRVPGGVNGLLELIGTVTLLDSLQAVAPKGIVCFTGLLGNAWVIHEFEPMAAIPSTVKLTHYSSETVTVANSAEALQQIVDGVAARRYRVSIDRVFHFEGVDADGVTWKRDLTVPFLGPATSARLTPSTSFMVKNGTAGLAGSREHSPTS